MNIQELKKLKIQFYKERFPILRSAVNAVLAEAELIELRRKTTLSDEEVDGVIKKTVTMFRESAKFAEDAGQDGDEFLGKAVYLQTLLPLQLTEEEIGKAVVGAINLIQATDISNMGKVMAMLKKEHGSKIDMKIASKYVKESLQKG